MSTPSGNPFAFPMGFGPAPEQATGNPILQSMEMMRQAWASFGGPASLAGQLPTPPILNVDELDRRIQELRTVENWLSLNLTMLKGSIQAMEVQRATLATLQSFANLGAAPAAGPGPSGGPSPLEVALGMQPVQPQSEPRPTAEPASQAPAASQAEAATDTAQSAAAADVTPQQAWWNMLQNQFNQIASAAAATLPAQTPPPAPGSAQTAPAAKAAPRKRAPRKTAARGGSPKA